MDISVLQNGSQASLIMEPFPHMVIEPALPPAIYGQLSEEYPEPLIVGRGGYKMQPACRYFAHDALGEGKISPLWTSFLRYHTSEAFFRQAADLLAPALERRYPHQLEFIRNAGTTPRNMGKSDIELECQFVVNLPCEQTVRTIHIDNPRELYAVLFYMRHADDRSTGGDLQLYKRKGKTVDYRGVREADPEAIDWVKDIGYGANKVVMFLNTPQSFHGVSPRSDEPINRRYMNIISEIPKRKGTLFRTKTKPWFELA